MNNELPSFSSIYIIKSASQKHLYNCFKHIIPRQHQMYSSVVWCIVNNCEHEMYLHINWSHFLYIGYCIISGGYYTIMFPGVNNKTLINCYI